MLLESKDGVVAGRRKHEQGEVLFVNLPLGYLESRTDGLLLHSFLHYFANEILHLPYLASVPDGTGGLVLNWHIDAASALKPMIVLSKAGIFDHGPFSAHFTAGPDVDAFNDGKGLDVDHNPEAQQWIRTFEQRGYAIGSHGGWIHNYFGEHLTDDNEKDFEQYLIKNDQALEHVDGQPIREYSAPLGNHPQWVTRWLQKHGFVAYYFSGDTGFFPFSRGLRVIAQEKLTGTLRSAGARENVDLYAREGKVLQQMAGEIWVDAKQTDDVLAERWEGGPNGRQAAE